MDIFMISREGSKQSIVACLGTAISLRQKGLAVTLMYDQEAALAMAEGKFEYTGLVARYADVTEKVITDQGFPTDPLVLLQAAKEAGVDVITCALWAAVARSKNELPSELRVVELDELFDIIAHSTKIMGTF